MLLISLRRLKWIAVIVPTIMVGVFENVRHSYFLDTLHGPIGNFVTMGIDFLLILLFTEVIFGIISRMQSNLVKRNQELSIINTMVAGVSQSFESDQILSLGITAGLQALRARLGVAWTWDESLGSLNLRAHRDMPAKMVQGFVRLGKEPSFLASLAKTEGSAAMKLPPMDLAAERSSRLVVLPLRAKGKLLGVIAIVDESSDPTPLDVELLNSIAGHVSMAIDNAELFRETLRRQQQTQALYQLGMDVSTLLDLEKVLDSVVEKAEELLGLELVALSLWDDHAQEMVTRCARGFRTDPTRQTRQRIWQELSRQVMAGGQPVQSTYQAEAEEQDSIVRVEGNIAHLAVPLKAVNRIIGVLHGAYRHPHVFSQEDMELLTSLANQAAIAVENTALYTQVQSLAVLEERDRLSREMHDSLAQVLGFLSMKASAAHDLLAAKHFSLARQELRQIEKAADEAYLDVREAILGLRTSVVLGGGLIRALKEYLHKFSSQSGIKAELVFAQGKNPHLAPATEIQIIRIIQEALTNVRKHALAKRVWVRLKAVEDEGEIQIEDDGQGFDLLQVLQREGRYGLDTMRERAESVGASLAIDTSPGQGTRVVISLPLRQVNPQLGRREGRHEPAPDSLGGRSHPL